MLRLNSPEPVPQQPRRSRLASCKLAALSLLSATLLAPTTFAQSTSDPIPANKANYHLAKKFSSTFLRKFTYDSSVTPAWIGDSETFWYRFRTSEGRRYWLVDAVAKTKVPLFDHDHLAALLSVACETPIDPEAMDLRSLKFDDKGDEMTFSAKGKSFTYKRSTEKLEKKEKKKDGDAADSSTPPRRTGRTRFSRGSRTTTKMTDKQKAEAAKQRKKRLMDQWWRALEEADKKKKAKENKGKKTEEKKTETTDPRRRPTQNRGHRSAFAPDLTTYVLAKKNNLYVIEREGDLQDFAKVEKPGTKKAVVASGKKGAKAVEGDLKKKGSDKGKEKKINGKSTEAAAKKKDKGAKKGTEKADAKKKADEKKEALRFPFPTKKAKQLTKDGEKDYSYGGSDEDDYTVPANVTWSPDSSSFYVTRGDSRGVAELFLVNSLTEPRPSLEKYKYPMPGEDKIRHSELMMFSRKTGKLIRLKPKWKDESYLDTRWLPNGELRVLRRDRMRRSVEYGIVNPETGDFKTLFSERFADVGMVTQSIRYLDKRNELVWWSERSGWAHFYLYSLDGKFKNAITRGKFRASSIVDVDEEKGLMWFRANGREKGENIYYEHLYRVRLDGGDLTLLDKGDATHRSRLSKSRKFLVDNCNRVDMSPISVLRDGEGELVMELEKADMSQLKELGWRAPERFVVKAADGITDLYGNMYKPFDFDPNMSYPIIAHVYPGPQTEGVTHTFSTASRLQELAQVGFIVIQVGHRGGAPTRSKAYASYGYFNMRDYPLEDKKTAIEQLAAKHSFIDINRIGIFGHSGGGFMTAAALLKPPYNKFFKVGVSTAGNHDNNVYNNSWAERYHGLKEKKAAKKKADDKKKADAEKKDGDKKDGGKNDKKSKTDGKKKATKKGGVAVADAAKKKQGDKKKSDRKQGDKTKKEDKVSENDSLEKDTKFDIKIATNAELAGNLVGKLLLIHGEIDNNVHPAGTMRLVNALILANKRFDMLIIPGARHSFGSRREYAKQRTWEYFAEHLLGDRQPGADITEKSARWQR